MTVTLSGCASGGYSVNIYSDGRIMETFYVELNQNAIELAGYDYLEVQNLILSKFEEVRTDLINQFYATHLELSQEKLDAVTQYVRFPAIENNMIGVSFTFNNYDDYKLFYNVIDDEQPDNEVTENHTFYVKTITTTYTAFKNAEESSLATELLSYFSNVENGNLTFTLEDVDFTYAYITSNTKLKSNADRSYLTGSGLRVHEWDIPNDDYDIAIEFYEYAILSTWWYISALLMTTIFIAWYLLFHQSKKIAPNNLPIIPLEEPKEPLQ